MENIKAKKKYGQNFLKDEEVLNKIIQSIPKNDNHIVEIGPGLGDLTNKLVKYKDVTAYEVDRDLYSILKVKFLKELTSKKLNIILGDVLEKWDDNSSLYSKKYDLIANLPYYIATNIILKGLNDNNCENIIVMIQKEVADKFTANCRDKEYSSLSVITQLISKEATTIIKVPPESFDPQPKVDSAVIHIKKDVGKKFDLDFNKFLKVCFIQPRKKLIKNLASSYNKELLNNIFVELNIKETLRPHEVDASLYSQIYTKVKQYGRETNKQGSC
ncbi:MAG: 16S rRNA (adenine(1518)-N(6)/adenine(1519)-N(6))-dimethyltransferase RsmA [Campylobacterota bacterium]|nr:16S rRNA (adenine(1518)-N(6)/adenine(1519)-N(6))-dimethyltransferase RsmA [Campylobacterota bacterium]